MFLIVRRHDSKFWRMRVFTGHPEFSIDFMEVLVQWKAEHTPDTFPPELADATVTELRTDPVTAKDAAAWHHLCRTFLKSSGRNGS